MRTYSEEKRSGTIELLLTSPVTDVEIIIGKFLGAMALYAAMLGDHADSHGAAVLVRQSRMESGRDRLPRAAADGRLLHLGRPADLEPDEEPDRRRHGHVRGVPAAVGRQLDRVVHRPDDAERRSTTCRSRITSTTSRRAILDTKHLVYYFSVMSFGLFLTARSVDTERWKG